MFWKKKESNDNYFEWMINNLIEEIDLLTKEMKEFREEVDYLSDFVGLDD
jgi:hypothetical protein